MSADPRLLDVAAVDAAIDAIERRLVELPEAKALAEAEVAHDEMAAVCSGLTDKRDRAERDAKRFEDEAATFEAKLSSVAKKLHDGSVSNPRELMALQAEQEMLQRKRNEVEDLELEVMLLLEGLGPQVAEASARLDEARSSLDQARKVHDDVVGRLRADLESRQAERQSVIEGIDPKLLAVYDKVRRRSPVGAAALDGDVCTACHMKLTTPEVTEVRAAQIGRCPSCDVILVPED